MVCLRVKIEVCGAENGGGNMLGIEISFWIVVHCMHKMQRAANMRLLENAT